jgi:hypothetical protein
MHAQVCKNASKLGVLRLKYLQSRGFIERQALEISSPATVSLQPQTDGLESLHDRQTLSGQDVDPAQFRNHLFGLQSPVQAPLQHVDIPAIRCHDHRWSRIASAGVLLLSIHFDHFTAAMRLCCQSFQLLWLAIPSIAGAVSFYRMRVGRDSSRFLLCQN